jgi:hypothetical protein
VKGEEKLPVLRSYLKRWKAEVGVFFEGVGPDSSEDDLRGAAPKHPVFRLSSSAHEPARLAQHTSSRPRTD